MLTFSEHLVCPVDGRGFEEPAPRNFSFNSPYGACEACDGLGTTFEIDPELVVPDADLSVNDGAIAPWRSSSTQYFTRMLASVAEVHGIDLDAPWSTLNAKQQKVLLHGSKGNLTVKYRNRYGRQRQYAPSTRARSRGSSAVTRARSRTRPESSTRATSARCRARPAVGLG